MSNSFMLLPERYDAPRSCMRPRRLILVLVLTGLLDGCGGGGAGSTVNRTPNPIPMGGPNAVPKISSLGPSCAPAGVLTVVNPLGVVGVNFVAGSVVRWNGTDLPTTLVSSTPEQILLAPVSASAVAAPGTATVTVFNPPPGGGTSNPLTFTIATGAGDPQSIAVDPAGKFAYVANGDSSCGGVDYVSMYTINPTTGALTSIGPPVPMQDDGIESVTVDPSGKFVHVTSWGDWQDSDGSIATYSINATTGALAYIGTTSGNCPGLCRPWSVAVDPSGKFAYAPYGPANENSVAMYAINATTGALTSIGAIAVEGPDGLVAVDPMGEFAYVATSSSTPGSTGNVSMYSIDITTGILTSIGVIAAGTNPSAMVVEPTGTFAYVANSLSNDISMYSIDATTGILTSIGVIAAGTNPSSMVVNPAGTFAYVANSGSNDLSMYRINRTTGALTPIGTIAAGLSPTSIAVHPSGKFVFVTNSGSNDVSIYSIDPATGALTLTGTAST